jgi:phage FluMu protein Com
VNKYRIYLLVTIVVASGAVWLYLRVSSDPEPQPFRNALACPICGKQLSKKGAPCLVCEAKKNRGEIEKSAEDIAKSSSGNTGRLVIGLSASSILLAVAFWPRLRNLIRPSEDQQEQFLNFRCAKCGRKLRYPASSAGMQGQCPKCKQICTFPLSDRNLSR